MERHGCPRCGIPMEKQDVEWFCRGCGTLWFIKKVVMKAAFEESCCDGGKQSCE